MDRGDEQRRPGEWRKSTHAGVKMRKMMWLEDEPKPREGATMECGGGRRPRRLADAKRRPKFKDAMRTRDVMLRAGAGEMTNIGVSRSPCGGRRRPEGAKRKREGVRKRRAGDERRRRPAGARARREDRPRRNESVMRKSIAGMRKRLGGVRRRTEGVKGKTRGARRKSGGARRRSKGVRKKSRSASWRPGGRPRPKGFARKRRNG
mmetsp:Transcript_8980/g.23415  ORF Transcript_8980/g.23415 Transcript_8980/m.23415 type:complete len:206 (-) Transcript_8980:1305-1922(-)